MHQPPWLAVKPSAEGEVAQWLDGFTPNQTTRTSSVHRHNQVFDWTSALTRLDSHVGWMQTLTKQTINKDKDVRGWFPKPHGLNLGAKPCSPFPRKGSHWVKGWGVGKT